MSQAVGNSIAQFASLEMDMGLVFAEMLKPASQRRALAVIHAARSFEVKLKMTDALADVALTGDALKTWRNLSSRLRNRRDFRDKLAHWAVTPVIGFANRKSYVALMPPPWSPAFVEALHNPTGNHKGKPISLAQIRQAQILVAQLSGDLVSFQNRLRRP